MAKILVVDDNALMRNIIKMSVKCLATELGEAADGKLALSWIATNGAPDLIITDINMPVMNGYDLVKAVRELDGCKATKLIVVTSEKAEETKQRLAPFGVEALMFKPFKKEQLTELVRAKL